MHMHVARKIGAIVPSLQWHLAVDDDSTFNVRGSARRASYPGSLNILLIFYYK